MKKDTLDKIARLKENKTTSLDVSSSRINELSVELSKFKKLKVLNLFNNGLNNLDKAIIPYENLTNLILGSNDFIIFPEQLKDCKRLKSLSFKSNRLTELGGIEYLSDTLEKLDLSNNRLSILRTNFASFSRLRIVNLSDNKITSFPKSLLLPSVQILNLSSNGISSIPLEINQMSKVRELDLSYNSITELPEEIGSLKELRVLNLTGNHISELPRSLSKLKKLTTLNLTGNNLDPIPIEIEKQGMKGILNYYQHLGISVKLNEAKLLVVGQGNVGKTFLINRMVKGVTPETVSTTGIDIVKWNIIQEQENTIRLNAWDFGGQEIYHSTHQFFLTKRSIYLFVWEARKDESLIHFDYWLNIIQTLSGASPVIVVMNKADDRIKEIDEKSLIDKFPDIKGFLKVSAMNGDNVETLVKLIRSEVKKLPHIGDKLPEAWSKIRTKLESIDENYIAFDEYKKICNSFGLSTEQSRSVSRYFHDLGVFLHFNDNSILKSVVFLNPQWVTNCVYRILDLPIVIEEFGEFSPDLLETELPDFDTTQIGYIIELMKKFELSLELSKNKFIVPELLKPSKPNLNLKLEDEIGIVYKYEFMPAGIVPRLIVRLKDSIFGNTFWKNGVVLEFEDSKGIIESNQFTREINIRVGGVDKASLLAIIRKELDNINSTLNYPFHKIVVRCCCDVCRSSNSPYMFDFDYLKRAKKAQIESVSCQQNLIDISLSKLIGPYQIFKQQKDDDFMLNPESLLYDLIEISSRLLERKFIAKIEDLISDNFTDALRFKGYNVTDQTRSGISNKTSGELDIMVRNSRSMPISIIEAIRLDSFGRGNKTIIEHLDKLLVKYDTNGLSKNFFLIYSTAENFSKSWKNYRDYIENLPHHYLYRDNLNLVSLAEKKELSKRANIKVLVTQHSRGEFPVEVFHLFINMNQSR